jgi:ABC-type polysaccharide/polyol phosphate export permease
MGIAQRIEPGAASARATIALEPPRRRRIVPTKRRIRPTDIFHERSVVRVLAARDFKVKYKQSLLGPLWLVFQPLALLAAFLVAFRGLADVEPGIPYVAFALSGLMVWSFFQASMTIGTASLITNIVLVRFTPCPRLAFPVASTLASVPTLAVTAVGALVAAAVTGTLSPRVVLLPIGFVWLFLLTIGTVIISASLAVRFRDIISVVPFFLQLGLFLAPVGYPLSALSDPVRVLIDLNPLTGLIEVFRWALLAGYFPSFEPIGVSIVMTAVVALSGWLLFSRLETTMADEI